MALKSYSAGAEPKFPSTYDVTKRVTLNFTDIISNSNKFYNTEVQVAKSGEARIYTCYGRTGGTQAKEYRVCDNQSHAEIECDKIIKSKIKKGYVEVKLAKADVGSDVGKAKIEVSVTVEAAKKAGVKFEEADDTKSSLHPEVKDLVRTWFGVTQDFIDLNLDTKKCALGQLSLDQLNKGRDILDEARKIIHLKKPDIDELNKLTNSYYSNIPHNFGYTRINADTLRLDNDIKVDAALDMLDVFQDAKNVEKVISKKSNIDSQYSTLNADLNWLDPSDPTWKWIDAMLHETKAPNHHFLGKLKTHKIFKVSRNGEESIFINNAESIAKECKKQIIPQTYSKFVKSRPDISKELMPLYKQANILPGWHGTRRANMIGITTRGFLIHPGAGVVTAGAMYGSGIYLASNSTKSINYCDVKGSYWAKGNNRTAYLYLVDAAFGEMKLVSSSGSYSKNSIKPHHSVFAQAGKGGVINDEMIIYNQTGISQQHVIRYIIEFETLVN